MRPPVWCVAAALSLAAGCGLVSGGPPHAPAAVDPGAVTSPPVPGGAFLARVVRVVDGDTFLARVGGSARPLRVRVIGVDTPETVKPDTPVACYGHEASTFTKRLLTRGMIVRVAHEPGGDLDRYGRQLWDVWLPDGRFLESVLVAAGAARAYPYPPQTDFSSLLGDLEQQAKAARRGLWGPPCAGRSFESRAPG